MLRWLPWFAGLFVVGLGWAMLTPLDEYPDEGDHVFRAAYIWQGVIPKNGAYTHGTGTIGPVPVGVHDVFKIYPECTGEYTETHCAVIPGDSTRVNTVSSEGRMFPLYYALVGWPIAISPDRRGVQGMRVVSAGLSAALLASAAAILQSMARRRRVVLAAALFAGLTPLAVSLTGGINPSSMELAGAACFWAAVLALVQRRGRPDADLGLPPGALSERALRWLALAGGVALVTPRLSGPIWVAVVGALSLLTVERAAWWPVLRRHLWTVALPIVAAGTAVVGWALVFHSYQVFGALRPITETFHQMVVNTFWNMDDILQQEVGYFSWLTIPPPRLALVCWGLIAVLSIVSAFLGGRRAGLVTLTGVALLVVMPFVIQLSSYPKSGLAAWQGRYMLPLVVGLPLLAVVPGLAARLERRTAAVIAWAILGLAALAHARSIYRVMHKWSIQFPAHKPALTAGAVTIAAGAVVLGALIAVLEWRSRRIPASDAEPAGPVLPAERRPEPLTAERVVTPSER